MAPVVDENKGARMILTEERWWVLCQTDLMLALERVENGEKPVDVMLDLYADSEKERP